MTDDKVKATTPTSAPVEDVGALVEGDLDWLRIALPKHHPNPHGLNPPEMIAANEAINDRIDRIFAALSPSLIQPQPAVVTKPKWRSPETDAELTTYQPADPPPGPPTGPLLVDTTNGQLWRFDMAGRLRKAIGRATAAELAALIQPQGEERSEDSGLAAADDNHKALVEALERIERWEMPETGRFWPDDYGKPDPKRPMSYASCWGSMGEQAVVRAIARDALAAFQSRQEEK